MTDTQAPPFIEVNSWVGGVPLFIMEDDNLIDDISEHGCWFYMSDDDDAEPQQMFPQVFYVVAEEHVVTKTKATTTGVQQTSSSYHPGVFKVITNLVGNAIHKVEAESVGLGDVEQQAYFTLPRIPYELINLANDFFREVYHSKGTESIIIFTFEPAYLETDNPSEGWGFLVPDQTNTAASCDYEPQSVIDEMPDDRDVRLVGTAHSHPGMAAFCSGTDKRDQAQFDGIHVTFGWKKGSQETEYYIELQMGGGQFVMDPKDVFTELPPPVENEQAKEWAKKVQKGNVGTGKGKATSGTGYGTGSGSWWTDPDKFKNLPKGCPTPEKVTLISAPLLTEKEMKNCPVCDSELKVREKETAKCLRCQSFLQWVEMDGVEDIIEHRKKANMPSHELNIAGDTKPWKSIWVWEEITGDDGKIDHQVYELFKGRSETQGASYQSNLGGDQKK